MLPYNQDLQIEVHWTEDKDPENIKIVAYFRSIENQLSELEGTQLPPNSPLPSLTHFCTRYMAQTRFEQPLNDYINVYINHNVTKVGNNAELEFRVRFGDWQAPNELKLVERTIFIEWREVKQGVGSEKWSPAFRVNVERFSDDFLGTESIDRQEVGQICWASSAEISFDRRRKAVKE